MKEVPVKIRWVFTCVACGSEQQLPDARETGDGAVVFSCSECEQDFAVYSPEESE